MELIRAMNPQPGTRDGICALLWRKLLREVSMGDKRDSWMHVSQIRGDSCMEVEADVRSGQMLEGAVHI
jgi:hypothetical protein